MDIVKFADGSSEPCAFWGATGRSFMIGMENKTFTEAAIIFSDESKTSRMKFYKNDELAEECEGFTQLERIVQEPNGIRVVLRKI